MTRIPALDPAAATGRRKELLDDAEASFGGKPNQFLTVAASPTTLEAMLRFFQILGSGTIDKGLGEQIAIAVAEVNGCSYCLSAHTAIGKLYGVADDELESSRSAVSADPKKEAALEFAAAVTRERGAVSDAEFAKASMAGWSDEEIAEILAHVALSTFTNYYAIATQTEIDWPVVRARETRAA